MCRSASPAAQGAGRLEPDRLALVAERPESARFRHRVRWSRARAVAPQPPFSDEGIRGRVASRRSPAVSGIASIGPYFCSGWINQVASSGVAAMLPATKPVMTPLSPCADSGRCDVNR
jgi:hypothetical protein